MQLINAVAETQSHACALATALFADYAPCWLCGKGVLMRTECFIKRL